VNIYQARDHHNAALAVAERTKVELIDVMRKSYLAGMSIVDLAKISGFSRPTVMLYVKNATTTPVEA
jgi:transposase